MRSLLSGMLHQTWEQQHGREDFPAVVKNGVDHVNVFKRTRNDASDIIKLVDIGLAVLAALQYESKEPPSPAAFDAVAFSLIGAYGLGHRRGQGEAYKRMGKHKRAALFIEPFTRETLPSKKKLIALAKHAAEVEARAALRKEGKM